VLTFLELLANQGTNDVVIRPAQSQQQNQSFDGNVAKFSYVSSTSNTLSDASRMVICPSFTITNMC